MSYSTDIKENSLLQDYPEVLELILKDQTTNKNIFWATWSYARLGEGYDFSDEITIEKITGKNGDIIKPRAAKCKEELIVRIKDHAEVFTPSWICNKQNNIVDQAWFGRKNVFNTETNDSWIPTKGKIVFPSRDGKSWVDYIKNKALEVSCGEAPYLASRYDTITGTPIPVEMRIGILDRKLRIVCENTNDRELWLKYAIYAIKNTYGYDWQGDNILLARESVLLTFIDYYCNMFGKQPGKEIIKTVAHIISWNIFQMDGVKCVIPNSCHEDVEPGLFATEDRKRPCPGCTNNNIHHHNGKYVKVADWSLESNHPIEIVEFHKLTKI